MPRQTTCSNCGGKAPLQQMMTVTVDNKTITNICPTCQNAKKIQLTFVRNKAGNFEYYQYYPVEA